MADFNFNPVNGLNDTSVFPDEPGSEAAARQQIQGLLDQIKEQIEIMPANSDLQVSLGTNGWKKNLITGEIEAWGAVGAGQSGTEVSFPVPFTDATSINAHVQVISNTYTTLTANCGNIGLNKMTVWSTSASSATVHWYVKGK